jgi:microcystin-dependent protein
VETVTLGVNQIPAHTHPPLANTSGSSNNPAGNTWAGWTGDQYSDQGPNTPMAPGALGAVGGSQPHDNMPPYLAMNFIISMFGIFPSQT